MNLDALVGAKLPAIDHAYDHKDAILYALGLGYGEDPMDPAQLAYVYEDGLQAVPSLCVVLAHPGFWLTRPEFDVAWLKLLHAEQAFQMHRPLPPKGKVRGSYRVLAVEDRGEKGSVLYQEKLLHDSGSGELIATVTTTLFLRGDGGQGSHGTAPEPMAPLPDLAPDFSVDLTTLPQQALIYRLSGDLNPIHASVGAAAKAGFDRPILHGLCTMGFAVRAILKAYCDDRPERLTSFAVRFTKPVFPGETLRFDFYRDGSALRFRGTAVGRDVVVLDRGVATIN